MLILDFYVDEPACFGVPPYLSPYCRYAAGALVSAGVAPERISYLTVDAWRAQDKALTEDHELVVLVAGHTVPGKYLGGKIGSVQEVLEFLEWRARHQPGGITLIGGPIRYASRDIQTSIAQRGGVLVRGDVELYAHRLAAHRGGIRAGLAEITDGERYVTNARRDYEQVDRWARDGAFLTRRHPNFPYIILELETYRGCTRDVFCSFCTEAFYGKPEFRTTESILGEVRELHAAGNRYYRLGRQADLYTYRANMSDFQNSFPRPVPGEVEALYAGIRKAAPDLKLLHLDNVNPGLIETFPEESRLITKIISEHNTPGDTAAMGLETADPVVVQMNDLKVNAEGALRAIEIVNEYGARRVDGIPAFLPGLNFLAGLPGESDATFQRNYEFLKDILDRGLLLRRINIRQTVSYRNTKLERLQNHPDQDNPVPRKRRRPGALEQKFRYFRDKIRDEIDREMLKRNFPSGALLREVFLEQTNQGYYLGRPLGSYPVTVKIPLGDPTAARAFAERRALDTVITGAEERSVTGLSYPVPINGLDQGALATLPGVGKKRAGRLVLEKPLADLRQLQAVTEGPVFPEGGESFFDFQSDPAVKQPTVHVRSH